MRTCKRLLKTIPLITLFACGGAQSTLRPAGPAASNIANLSWIAIIIFSIVCIVMWVLFAIASVRKRGNFAEHEPWTTGGGQSWVWIGGFAVPFVILTLVFVLSTNRMSQFPMHDGANLQPDILVIGHQWWWEVRYVGQPPAEQIVTANEIHIPAGKAVNIALESADVIHSFWVPRLHGKVDMIPGQINYIRVQANQPGNYVGQCGEYCGEQHAHMRLLVVADSPSEFEKWKAQMLKPGAEPQDAEAAHGRDVFLHAECAFCHTIAGTQAQGKVGPDLTHIASRQMIAANSYANNKGNLGGWVVHAQTLKPDNEMPNLSVFNGPDLRALVAYLEELK